VWLAPYARATRRQHDEFTRLLREVEQLEEEVEQRIVGLSCSL
jgi:hypothetical protein